MGGPVRKDHAIAALVLGAIEVVFGLIITICSFVLSSKANMSASLTPYWAGIAFIIPGIIGVVCGFTKSFCAMVAFMVINIIAFIIEGIGCILVAIVVAIWAALASHLDDCVYDNNSSQCTCIVDGKRTDIGGIESCDVLDSITALLTCLVVFLILAAMVTLASSILGCIASCCSNKSQPQTVIIQQPGMVMQQEQPPQYDQK